MTELAIRRLLTESLPIAVVLAFWTLLAAIVHHPAIGRGLRLAAIVMATLYVVVRGAQLAQVRTVGAVETRPSRALRQNLRVAAAAGVWFLGAFVAAAFEALWDNVVRVEFLTAPLDGLVFVAVGTGVGTVLLYAVTTGTSALRAETPFRARRTSD